MSYPAPARLLHWSPCQSNRLPRQLAIGLGTLIALVAGSLSAAAGQHRADEKRPNIILVMADDQGWGDVGYNGHPFVKTPHLDEMSRKGFVFDRFYAAAPVCSPTRASVMTGRTPIRTKVTNHGRYLRPQEETIGEALRDAGYSTGIFGKVHLGSGQPNSPCNPSSMGFDEWVIGLNFFDNDPWLSRNGKVERRTGRGTEVLMDDAIEFVRRQAKESHPFFAVIWFPSPHDPHQEVPPGPPLYTGEKHAGYYRAITLLDQQVGRLRQALRTLGIQDNTILWYTSDNGGLVHETSGGRAKKGSIYEGGLRVPSVVEWPLGQLTGRTSVPVMSSDLFPTLMTLANVEWQPKHPLDGIDMADVSQGQLKTRPQPMGFWHLFQAGQATWSDRILKDVMEKQENQVPVPHNPTRMQKDVYDFPQFPEATAKGHAAWNDWPWKLHRIDGERFELYHLEKDPMESNNLAADPQYREQFSTMSAALDAWMRSVVRSLNGDDYAD